MTELFFGLRKVSRVDEAGAPNISDHFVIQVFNRGGLLRGCTKKRKRVDLVHKEEPSNERR